MDITILPVNHESLVRYSTIPIGFKIKSRFIVKHLQDETGFRLEEETVEPPQFFDYDVIDGEGPTRWVKQFDTSSWRLFEVKQDGY
jgi:hypothetical protein